MTAVYDPAANDWSIDGATWTAVTRRVVDTDRTAGTQALDTITIDDLLVRTGP